MVSIILRAFAGRDRAGAGSVSNTTAGALTLNPAAMAGHAAGLHAQGVVTSRSLEERRAYPVFDRFEDINNFGIYVSNNNWFYDIQGGLQYNFNLAAFPYLKALAVGRYSELDLNYGYLEEVRENIFGDRLLAYNQLNIDGRLTRYSVGAAFEITSHLHIGLQAGMLTGRLENSRSVDFIENDNRDLYAAADREMDGSPILASFGATYAVTPHFTLGSHLRLPYSVDYNVSSYTSPDKSGALSSSETIDYPMQWTAAFEYRGRHELQTRLNVDFSYEWWSQSDYTVDGRALATTFEDAIIIKTGIEHIFFNQIPLQFGLQYRTLFQRRSDTRTLVSAGTGFRGDRWQVDLAGGISRLDYRQADLFDDALYGGDRSNSPTDSVDERFFFGLLTLRVDIL